MTAANGTGTAGRLDSGDWIRFTWTEPIAPASILTGWTGTSQAITVARAQQRQQRRDALLLGATQLNLVLSATDLKLGGNFVSTDSVFPATMVQSGNSITVTLGTRTSGTVLARPSPTRP